MQIITYLLFTFAGLSFVQFVVIIALIDELRHRKRIESFLSSEIGTHRRRWANLYAIVGSIIDGKTELLTLKEQKE